MRTNVQNLYNLSYFDKEINQEIIELVGKGYNIIQSIRRGGTGSPRMLVHEASDSFKEILSRDKYMNYCNIELRPKGMIIRFRSRLEAYGWVVPFADGSIHVSTEKYHIQSFGSFMELVPFKNSQSVQSFFKKKLSSHPADL